LDAAWAAMQRMSLLYPIRNGINRLDEDLNAGLRYILDDNPMDRPMGIPADSIDAAKGFWNESANRRASFRVNYRQDLTLPRAGQTSARQSDDSLSESVFGGAFSRTVAPRAARLRDQPARAPLTDSMRLRRIRDHTTPPLTA
jgi:hypothetical protein